MSLAMGLPFCKECTSYYRKLAAKMIQIQQEERQEHWGQAWDKPHQQQVQWHEHEHAQDAQHLSMHWERVVFVTLFWCRVTCTSWLKVFLSLISSTFIVIHERFSLSSSSPSTIPMNERKWINIEPPDEYTIDTIFRIILSVNQLSVYGSFMWRIWEPSR